jgi:hypothetical protein
MSHSLKVVRRAAFCLASKHGPVTVGGVRRISKKTRLSRISNVKDWVSLLDQWTLNCLKDILGCSDSTVQSIMDCVKDTTIETNFLKINKTPGPITYPKPAPVVACPPSPPVVSYTRTPTPTVTYKSTPTVTYAPSPTVYSGGGHHTISIGVRHPHHHIMIGGGHHMIPMIGGGHHMIPMIGGGIPMIGGGIPMIGGGIPMTRGMIVHSNGTVTHNVMGPAGGIFRIH